MGNGTDMFSTFQLISSGAGAAARVGGAYSESQALKAEGNYKGTVADLNARQADIDAASVRRQGDLAAGREDEAARALEGTQRVATAANGLRVGQGSAGALVAETEGLSRLEQETLRHNAYMEALGYKSRAASDRAAGTFARMSGRNAGRGVMTAGLLGAARDVNYGAYRYGRLRVPAREQQEDSDGYWTD